MTTKQTIDGVPREDLRELHVVLCNMDVQGGSVYADIRDRVRALLDADKVNNRQMGLMQYVEAHPIKPTGLSQGWNLTRKHDGFVVGHQSVAYPPDGKAIERAERDGYVWVPFLLPAAKPQCEPVAWMDPRSPEMHATISNEVKQHNLKFGGAPSAAVNGYSIPLYAEQPAPVAVVLPEHRDSSLDNPNYSHAHGWNACLDEVKRLNP